jgi:hypothetical protein
MDFDIKTLFYIALGIIYFVVSSKKKGASKKTGNPNNPERGGETLGPPPMRQPTFEELLQEFTGKKTEVLQPATVQAKPVSQAKPQLKEIPRIERNTILENSAQNKRAEKARIALLEEMDDEVEQESYAEAFGSLEGARKAFVMSEIFKRKY